MNDFEESIGFVDMDLRKEINDNGKTQYLLDVVCLHHTEYADIKLTIKGIRFDVWMPEFNTEIKCGFVDELKRTVDIGFGKMSYESLSTEVVNVRPVEVTMEDIEKKFGRKVKIVNRRSDVK